MTHPKNTLRLENFLPYKLATLSARISTAIAQLYEQQFGISLPEWRVMAILGEYPDISAGEVAFKTAMDKVAVSRAVNKLLDRDLLTRHLDKEDRRRSILSLSDAGTEVYDRIVPLALAYEKQIIDQIDHTDLDELYTLLDRLEEIQLHLGDEE